MTPGECQNALDELTEEEFQAFTHKLGGGTKIRDAGVRE